MRKMLPTYRAAGVLVAGLLALVPLCAFGQRSAGSPLPTWRQDSQGLSSNAALAFYRLRQTGPSHQRPTPRRFYRDSTATSALRAPSSAGTYRYAPVATPGLGLAGQRSLRAPDERAFGAKPFAAVRPC